jgi:hypothetical protein
VNVICENALILGFAQGQRAINSISIAAVAADLHLTGNGNTNHIQNHSKPANTPDERLDVTVTAPVPVEVPAPTIMPTLERYAPRRGWRVLFGLDQENL